MNSIFEWLQAATLEQSLASFAAGMLLAVLSVTAVLLSTSKHSRIRFFGFTCGLLSQPIWFYIAIDSHNLGLFITSVFFTAMWLYRFIPALHHSTERIKP